MSNNPHASFTTMVANLKGAIHDRKPAEIGGGTFSVDEMTDVVKTIKAMEDALSAARLLCANLERGGEGHATLVDNFRLLDDSI